jgi:hypothetical protein
MSTDHSLLRQGNSVDFSVVFEPFEGGKNESSPDVRATTVDVMRSNPKLRTHTTDE